MKYTMVGLIILTATGCGNDNPTIPPVPGLDSVELHGWYSIAPGGYVQIGDPYIATWDSQKESCSTPYQWEFVSSTTSDITIRVNVLNSEIPAYNNTFIKVIDDWGSLIGWRDTVWGHHFLLVPRSEVPGSPKCIR